MTSTCKSNPLSPSGIFLVLDLYRHNQSFGVSIRGIIEKIMENSQHRSRWPGVSNTTANATHEGKNLHFKFTKKQYDTISVHISALYNKV